jgi:uncharacterized membrane protein YgcG
MKSKILLTLLVLFAASYASAGPRTLRWSRLAITARLDADGRLHVQERHSIVFNGDWNGGERTFRQGVENLIHLDRLSRIDESGQAIPLHEDKSLTRVDDYGWTSSNTLRWRSRRASDPPFENREITYVLEYTDERILVPADDTYLLDHNFGLPDLPWPIDAYSVDFSLDPIWQPLDSIPPHIARTNAAHGENVTVTARLRHTGATRPSAVNFGAPASLRYALLALLAAGLAFFGWQFRTREQALGRFAPLPDPASIDRRWLEEHLFTFQPEVVGAAWDDRTGAPEVAAVIARLAHEGKLSSRVEKRGWRSDDLVLTLMRPKDSFDGYEAALVKALFIDGDTTSTQKIKAHYKSVGFDPVSKIRAPLERRVQEMGKQNAAPKIDRRWTLLVVGAGAGLVVLGAFDGALNILGALVALCVLLTFYVGGLFGAIDYRRRVSRLGAFSLEFVPAIVLVVAVTGFLLVGMSGMRFSGLMLSGLALISLGAVRSLFNLARSRDAGERLETRRRLTAAREYFAQELRKPQPALEDAWFPYFVAFGLGPNVDRWFRSFGAASVASSSVSTIGSSSFGSHSSGSAPGGWTGGGGASGGAGASGTWALAVSQLAAGVPSPSSGGSGGGSSGGGSSGGGGAGGW